MGGTRLTPGQAVDALAEGDRRHPRHLGHRRAARARRRRQVPPGRRCEARAGAGARQSRSGSAPSSRGCCGSSVAKADGWLPSLAYLKGGADRRVERPHRRGRLRGWARPEGHATTRQHRRPVHLAGERRVPRRGRRAVGRAARDAGPRARPERLHRRGRRPEPTCPLWPGGRAGDARARRGRARATWDGNGPSPVRRADQHRGPRTPPRVRHVHHAAQQPRHGRRTGPRPPRPAQRGGRTRPRHVPGPPVPAALPRDVDAAQLGRRPDRAHSAGPQRHQCADATAGRPRESRRESRPPLARPARARPRCRLLLGCDGVDGHRSPLTGRVGRRARGDHRHHPRYLVSSPADSIADQGNPPPRQRRGPRTSARPQHPDLGGRGQAPHARPHRPALRRLGHPGRQLGSGGPVHHRPRRRRSSDPGRPRPT